MLLPSRKLLFIHIPKCAGTSVEVYFAGGDWADIDPVNKHLTALEAREFYGRELFEQCFKFSVVRNPWARLLSFFNLVRKAQPKIEFDPWIRRVCSPEGLTFERIPVHRTMCEYVCGPRGELLVDFVAKQETLSDDFQTILSRLGQKEDVLHHAMVGQYDRNYRKWYTPETRDMVAERFRDDVERFGYNY